jgi:hypothetical protein
VFFEMKLGFDPAGGVFDASGRANGLVDILGRPTELVSLGKQLLRKEDVQVFGEPGASVYPVVLERLVFKIHRAQCGMKLMIRVVERTCEFESGEDIAEKFGRGLITLFEGSPRDGTHYHYDYECGDQLLAPGSFGLIVGCRAQPG